MIKTKNVFKDICLWLLIASVLAMCVAIFITIALSVQGFDTKKPAPLFEKLDIVYIILSGDKAQIREIKKPSKKSDPIQYNVRCLDGDIREFHEGELSKNKPE